MNITDLAQMTPEEIRGREFLIRRCMAECATIMHDLSRGDATRHAAARFMAELSDLPGLPMEQRPCDTLPTGRAAAAKESGS